MDNCFRSQSLRRACTCSLVQGSLKVWRAWRPGTLLTATIFSRVTTIDGGAFAEAHSTATPHAEAVCVQSTAPAGRGMIVLLAISDFAVGTGAYDLFVGLPLCCIQMLLLELVELEYVHQITEVFLGERQERGGIELQIPHQGDGGRLVETVQSHRGALALFCLETQGRLHPT